MMDGVFASGVQRCLTVVDVGHAAWLIWYVPSELPLLRDSVAPNPNFRQHTAAVYLATDSIKDGVKARRTLGEPWDLCVIYWIVFACWNQDCTKYVLASVL